MISGEILHLCLCRFFSEFSAVVDIRIRWDQYELSHSSGLSGGKGSGKGKGWSSGGGGYRGSRQTTMSPSGVVKVILKPNAGGSGSSSRKGGKGGGKGYRNYGK